MAGKAYRKGAKYEYYVKKTLEEKGYLVVRSAGSHGPFDLVAIDIKKREILLVQVKKRKNVPSPVREALARLAGTYAVKPMLYLRGEWVDLSKEA